jgi:hypothetical protein
MADPLSRAWFNTLVDDDGSGNVGTVWNKGQVDGLMDTVDAALVPVVVTADPRLADARTPVSHAATHAPGGSDPIPPQAPAPPLAHRVTHDTGGTDALQAVRAEIINSGYLPIDRIQDNSVALAKLPDIAPSMLIGRRASEAGDPEPIGLGANLVMSGQTLSVTIPGGGTGAVPYNFSTAVVPPPTTGLVRFNNADYALVTKVWVHAVSSDAHDIFWSLLLAHAGSTLLVQNAVDHTRYGQFVTTGEPVDFTTYVEFPVTHVKHGTLLANNEASLVLLTPGAPQAQAAGSTSQVQFNDAGVFAGDAGLTYDKTNKGLAIGASPAGAGHLRLPNTSTLAYRNNGNTGDIPILQLWSDDRTYLGSVADKGVVIRSGVAVAFTDAGGAVGATFDATSKLFTFTRPANKLGAWVWNGTTVDFNLASGVAFEVGVGNNWGPVIFSNPPPAGVEFVFTIYLNVTGGPFTVGWPATVTWDEDVVPTLPGTGRTIVLGFSTINGGGRYRGYIGGRNFAT